MPTLLEQLCRGTDRQKEEAATQILARLADNNTGNKVAIARANGIVLLVALARDGTQGQKNAAATALARLAFNNADNQVEIAKAGGIAPLVTLARGGTWWLWQGGTNKPKEAAAEALTNLARQPGGDCGGGRHCAAGGSGSRRHRGRKGAGRGGAVGPRYQ